MVQPTVIGCGPCRTTSVRFVLLESGENYARFLAMDGCIRYPEARSVSLRAVALSRPLASLAVFFFRPPRQSNQCRR
jgi:hypothetical protein